MSAAVRLLAVVPILGVLGWATVTAVDVIRADDLVREASVEMGTWAAAGREPAPETWISVRDKLEAGILIRPNDPSTHELRGMLGSLRRDDTKQMDAGLAHLVRALELRPVSPYTWGNLVEARYLRGESGAGLEAALMRAAQLGPSEPGVQRVVADYGLAVWDELRPETRTQVDRIIASGMRRNPLEMLQISERRGRLDTACRHLAGSSRPVGPRHGRLCPWEITP